MKFNKINTKKIKKTLISTVKTAKNNILNINDFALKNTEEVVLGSYKTITKWQNATDKIVNKGFKLVLKQQGFIFDTLDSYKMQVLKKTKKVVKKAA